MKPPAALYRPKEPKPAYDVVVIGGGLHGLAAAYFLAREQGIRKVAVLERKWLGFGGSGRNTEVFRANQRATEILPLYKAAVELWPKLSAELDFNLMVTVPGLVGLAHTEGGLNAMRQRAETGRLLGIETRMLTVEEIGRLVPALNLGRDVNMPVVGGYFHPPCGTARHDAAVWGLARAAGRLGVDLCPGVEVKGMIVKNSRVEGVVTDKGDVSARLVLNAAGGWSAEVARLAGVRLPVMVLPLQAMVTEPIKPFLKVVLVSEFYFVYLHQTLKGEIVTGSHMDPYQSYSLDSNYDFPSHQAACLLELFPDLERVKLMRQWSGLTDMTPDHAPIMGPSPVEGFYLDVGWGYFGFKAGAVAGRLMAEYLATGKRPALISALGLERFSSGRLIQENVLAQT